MSIRTVTAFLLLLATSVASVSLSFLKRNVLPSSSVCLTFLLFPLSQQTVIPAQHNDDHPMASLQRRHSNRLEQCTRDLATTLWTTDRPDNATAGICYSGKYELADWSATHWKFDHKDACSWYHWFLGPQKNKFVVLSVLIFVCISHLLTNISLCIVGACNRYECFFLLGANSFHAKNDAGYKNLGIIMNTEGCTWAHKEKNLTCIETQMLKIPEDQWDPMPIDSTIHVGP